MQELTQYPLPGRHLRRYSGDTVDFILKSASAVKGQAFLSTNIGNAALHRAEIVEQVENRITAGGQDWTNIPMERVDEFTFRLKLALTEPGHFEAKCCIVPEDESEPAWPDGDNVHVNVSPASYCSANSIYCAFVRQFDGNKKKTVSTLPDGITQDELRKFDDAGYALIPPSGTFRDLIGELDHIVNHLKCRIIHLLPVNPTPTVYGRMGRFGSPYASLDFTAVDPALAEFDRKATPLDQFIELADAVHCRDAKLFIDIAINHTGWAAKLHETHPEWFVREADGVIHSPGAWGVTWGDLTELDTKNPELWKYLADAFLVWCSRGVDGFRCDAGYMIPVPAWEYIVARVRNEYPETVFLLEGLGGDPAVTQRLLDHANLDWAYSELFQNYSRPQIEGYLRYAWGESSSNGVMVNYAETHDNSRLAAVSPKYASMRTALAALTSSCGAFGFANGVEWFASEKIDVHESSALNWDAKINQTSLIARLNLLLAVHPAFYDGALAEFIDSGAPGAVLFARQDAPGRHGVVVAVNLECGKTASLEWGPSYTPFLDPENAVDLISGKTVTLARDPRGKLTLALPAGAFVCLSSERVFLDRLSAAQDTPELALDYLDRQAARAMALRLISCRTKSQIVPLHDFDMETLADSLLCSPEDFLKRLTPDKPQRNVVRWHWPEDVRREVMLPPDHILLVTAPYRFRCRIAEGKRIAARVIALKDHSGRYFALIPPLPAPQCAPKRLTLEIRVYTPGRTGAEAASAPLLQLPPDIEKMVVNFNRADIYDRNRMFLQANGRGAIIHQCMELEKLNSRYDAILLANLNPDYPEDRHVMWRRIRVWVVWHARRQELKHEHIHLFHLSADGGGVWDYLVPVGNGMFIELCLKMEIVSGRNAVLVTLFRHPCASSQKRLPDAEPVRIIVRPDIEDRNFHYSTKAAMGPERYWSGQIVEGPQSFEFRAAPDRVFSLRASKGRFIRKDEWLYMNYQPNEAARGLDPNSDLYSPGAFRAWLSGNEELYLAGQILTDPDEEKIPPAKAQHDPFRHADCCISAAALKSLGAFVVKRDSLKTVIAGYPWFLDWGRDTLIAARGLIAAPEFRDDVKQILIQFARFEENGTIPNMIAGADARNRDTSDAPLWLFTAVDDLCRAEGNDEFLNTPVRGRQTLLDVLETLALGILAGTPNGIGCDPESLLVFSPAHFTWMDTNYPAGTPREGYPVEIQALWFAALSFLARRTPDAKRAAVWSGRAEKVRAGIYHYFCSEKFPYLSDCLHCQRGTPAAKAEADDHLRPNQLLAITLGAVNDPDLSSAILDACSELLIPGAIRSLADRETAYALPVYGANGALLNDPKHPYRGRYEGDEDTRRKVAYHNGTAWTWQFPSYAEACYRTYGEFGKPAARAYLASMILQMDNGCITQLPEILDGDFPHTPRGCDAQAWGMSEFFRVWKMLH